MLWLAHIMHVFPQIFIQYLLAQLAFFLALTCFFRPRRSVFHLQPNRIY